MGLFLDTNDEKNKTIEAMRDFLICKNIVVASGSSGVDNCSIECAALIKKYLGVELYPKNDNVFRCLTLDDVRYIEDMLGYMVPDPFYRGFPDSVRNLDEMTLAFDRLIHYHETYGRNNFDGPTSHSLFEEVVERTAVEEHVEVKKMILIAPTELFDTVRGILVEQLKGSRPLDGLSFRTLATYINFVGFNNFNEEINSRQTLIELFFEFYVERGNVYTAEKIADRFNLDDTYKLIKLIAAKKDQHLNKLSLSSKERKMIELSLRKALNNNVDIFNEMLEKAYLHKKVWCGVLHHIHFKPKTNIEVTFVNEMRTKGNHSIMSTFEDMMSNGYTVSAAKFILQKNGVSQLLRHLDYIMSRTKKEEDAEVILQLIERNYKSASTVVLLQLYYKYSMPDNAECRTFTYTYGNRVVSYTEENPKVFSITTRQRKAIALCISRTLSKKLENKLEGIAYINPEMNNIGVEINSSATNKGIGTLPAGSRIKLDEGRIFRLFTYWSGADDVDLSMIGLDENFKECGEFSWRSRGLNGPVVFSGDITNGYNGASEYFDVNIIQTKIAYPNMRYLVCCDNLFRGGHDIDYLDQFECKAGYMVRSEMGSRGDIFDAKTVATSFKVTAHSKFAILFMIDMETMELIWVNRSVRSNSSIASGQNLNNMEAIANATKIMNLGMLIQSAAEGVTANPEDADIIVDWQLPENAKENATLIRPCDTEVVAGILR